MSNVASMRRLADALDRAAYRRHWREEGPGAVEPFASSPDAEDVWARNPLARRWRRIALDALGLLEERP